MKPCNRLATGCDGDIGSGAGNGSARLQCSRLTLEADVDDTARDVPRLSDAVAAAAPVPARSGERGSCGSSAWSCGATTAVRALSCGAASTGGAETGWVWLATAKEWHDKSASTGTGSCGAELTVAVPRDGLVRVEPVDSSAHGTYGESGKGVRKN